VDSQLTTHCSNAMTSVDGAIDQSLKVHHDTVAYLRTSRLIECVSEMVVHSIIINKRKLLFAGNGGSAADAQHMAGEYISRFLLERPPLRAIALTTDTSVLTAIGNDYGYENVFERQVIALGEPGDILFLYSTSGNSENILKAASVGKDLGLLVIGFTGSTGGRLKKSCNYNIAIPSDSTPRVQEMHLLVGHLICQEVERLWVSKRTNQ